SWAAGFQQGLWHSADNRLLSWFVPGGSANPRQAVAATHELGRRRVGETQSKAGAPAQQWLSAGAAADNP
ncbi:MAG: hypothetical protein ACKO0M_12335, partial [Cyanobium sp.]